MSRSIAGIRLIAILSLMLIGLSARAKCQTVEFCSFPLPKGVLDGHTDFQAIYTFDIDHQGHPINIKPLNKWFTDATTVGACIERWNFTNSISQHLTASFTWKHSLGWTSLTIVGSDVKLQINLSGNRCPYCDVK